MQYRATRVKQINNRDDYQVYQVRPKEVTHRQVWFTYEGYRTDTGSQFWERGYSSEKNYANPNAS